MSRRMGRGRDRDARHFENDAANFGERKWVEL